MSGRIAVISDPHGNAAALEAVSRAVRAAKPDAVFLTGDLVLNGPEPVATLDLVRELEAAGAMVVAGNTDIAVTDFDYAAAFPWMEDVPETIRHYLAHEEERASIAEAGYRRTLAEHTYAHRFADIFAAMKIALPPVATLLAGGRADVLEVT